MESIDAVALCWYKKECLRRYYVLGTNVLKKLGFRVHIPDTKEGTTDLLGTGSWHLQPVSQDGKSTKS